MARRAESASVSSFALALDAQQVCEHYAALTFVYWRQARCHARDEFTTAACRVTRRAQIFSLIHEREVSACLRPPLARLSVLSVSRSALRSPLQTVSHWRSVCC
jgi:hypothetical protein